MVHTNDSLATLFPPDVVTCRTTGDSAEHRLLLEERQWVRHAGPKRQREFAHGRACARIALRSLGMDSRIIPMGDQGEPIWPNDVIGSISHTEGFCGVAVARRARYAGIGFDVECLTELDASCWDYLLDDVEFSYVRSLPVRKQRHAVLIIFSAKECLYKCQYPITRQWLGFEDVTIRFPDARFTFEATFKRATGDAFRKGETLAGKYAFLGDHILAGMVIRN